MPKRKPEQPPPRKPFDPVPLLAGAAIVILTLAIYRPAANGAFIWDDNEYLTENQTIQHAGGLDDIWRNRKASPQYYPLVFTSFWVERQLWGSSPRGYHEINIILHAASAVLLWRILKFLGVPGAYLAALIFAAHPLMVESVAWITERKNTLSLLFYLLAARFYLRFAFSPSPSGVSGAQHAGAPPPSLGEGRGEGMTLYCPAILFFICALLSKSVTASWPAAMLLMLYWKNRRITKRDLALLAPFFVLGIIAGLNTAYLERVHVGAVGPDYELRFVQRLLIAARAVWFYAGKLILPINLTFMYPRWTINPADWSLWLYPAGLALVVAALVIFRKRIGVGPLVAVLFFIGTLFPALGFFNVYPMRYSFVADHFTYHASIGLIVLAAAGLARLWSRPGFQRYAPMIGVPMIFGLSIMTIIRCEVFENDGTLFTDVIDKNPGSWMAWKNLAEYTVTTRPTDPAARETAFKQLDWAQQLAPHVAENNYNLGRAHLDGGRADKAETYFNRTVMIEPAFTNAWIGLAEARRMQGKIESAEFAANKALALRADHPDARYEMGMIEREAKRDDAALKHFQKAVSANPGHIFALREIANIHIARKEYKQAVEALERRVAATPDDADSLFDLGAAMMLAGRDDEGRRHVQRAIALKPALARRVKTNDGK